MTSLGRRVFLAMIPMHVVMVFWVWLGRGFFGVLGWFIVFIMLALPFLLAALATTTVLAFRRSFTPHFLTRSQAWSHLVLWLGMGCFGFFLVDGGDTPDSVGSAFTQVFGKNDVTMSFSGAMTAFSALAVVVAWIVLLAQLTRQPRPIPVGP